MEDYSVLKDNEWLPFFTLPLGRFIEKGGGDLGVNHLILDNTGQAVTKFWLASDQGEVAVINWTKMKVEKPVKKGKSSLDVWKKQPEFCIQ